MVASLALLLVTLAVAFPPRDAGLVAHWRLAASTLENGKFRDGADARPLMLAGAPRFLGDGAALLLPEGAGFLTADGAATAASLPAKKLTLEAWVAIDRAGPWGGFVGAIEDNGDYERGWLLGHRQDSFTFALATAETGRLSYLTHEASFRPGRWYHVVGTYDGLSQRLFVDGKLVAESSAPGGKILYHDTHRFVVGAYLDQNERYPLVGALYEVRVYERSLSASDIASRYRKQRRLLPAIPARTATGVKETTVAEMQPAINAAIDRGVDRLLRSQLRDGSWGHHAAAYRNGQTALSTYTLLKSGLPANHPAVKAAFRYLRLRAPSRTYSVACQLLALSALGEAADLQRARELTDILVEFESDRHRGSWAYPNGAIDLSNTQYAALGLWAAYRMGIPVRKELWQRMVRTVCEDYQGPVAKVPRMPTDDDDRDEMSVAGYSYRKNDGSRPVTGSMTTAGLCVLALGDLCTDGGLGARYERPAHRQSRMALDWLDHHWSVAKNPGRGGTPYYYLYGIERVGALFELDTIGTRPWYRDGAEHLLKKQTDKGGWGVDSDTCFALLFLARATAPTSGGNEIARRDEVWVLDEGDVHLRAMGGMQVTVWITGFDAELLARFADQPVKKRDLRVVRVEYLVDDEVRATVEGTADTPWGEERFAARLLLERPGEHTLTAHVHVVPHGDYPDTYREPAVLPSTPLVFQARMTPEAFLTANARTGGRNALADGRPRVEASSQRDDAHVAAKAVDGLLATQWITAVDDEAPKLTLELARPVEADTLVLYPIDGTVETLGAHDVPTRVAVRIDRATGPLEVILDPLGVVPGILDFGTPVTIRRIELRILERAQGTKSPGSTGFSEVSLELQ